MIGDWARTARPTLPTPTHHSFALDRPSQRLGLPTGQHITFKLRPVGGTDADEDVMKPYTPITDDRTRGTVAFVVKVYPEGRVSRALDAVPVGGRILAKGPRGRFKYERGIATHIGLIAGGTGITPCYQVAAATLSDPADTTAFSLVFANVAEEDILIKKEIDGLVLAHPTRFSVHYVLNSPPLGWTGSVGFVTPDILKKHMPAPGPGVLVARCGPPPMNKAVAAALEGLGYEKNMTFEF